VQPGLDQPAAARRRNGLDLDKLERTVRTAVRMLDNVIDINYYSVDTARNSNILHRPVGLGLMGFQDALYKQHIAYGSEEAVTFADRSMEAISYFAIDASSELAEERGSYSSYRRVAVEPGHPAHRLPGQARGRARQRLHQGRQVHDHGLGRPARDG
jgi:ribonucleotide reductase alpha subunit